MSVAQYYPFNGSKGRLRLGLNPIPYSDWIQYEDDFSDRILEKKNLIQEQPMRVLQCLDSSIDAQNELLQSVLSYLTEFKSDLFTINNDSVTSLMDNNTYEFSEYKNCPLELVTYLAADDYCLLEKYDDDYRLVAASVCAPTWWELSEKIGKPLIEVHAPIVNLEEKIGRMIRHFLANLNTDECYQRSNWFLFPSSDLCIFPNNFYMYEDINDLSIDDIENRLFLRSERQTFRKLKNTNHIAFGIKVYVSSISVVKENTSIAEDLYIALNTMTSEQKEDLGIQWAEQALAEYLQNIL